MPRWGERLDALEQHINQDENAIPIQFGPGLETIYPSPGLVYYESGWSLRFSEITHAPDSVHLLTAVECEMRAYQKALRDVSPNEYRHVEYLHREALQRADTIKRRFWDHREVFQDFMGNYQRSRIVSNHPSSMTALAGVVEGQQATELPDDFTGDRRKAAQGQFRPSGWHAVGPHPGYR